MTESLLSQLSTDIRHEASILKLTQSSREAGTRYTLYLSTAYRDEHETTFRTNQSANSSIP